MSRRGAVSIAELLLVSWLYLVVLTGLAAFAGAQGRMAREQERALRRAELFRTTRVILGAELRYLSPADLRTGGGDSIRLRAIRGGGRVCEALDARIHVEYRGLRLPEPTKDSVLLLLGGREVVSGIAEVHGGAECGTIGLRLQPFGGDTVSLLGAMALVFETGTYAVRDGALRYRLGAAGRQPLTEALLEGGDLQLGNAALHVTLRPDPDSVPGGSGVVTIPLLNAP